MRRFILCSAIGTLLLDLATPGLSSGQASTETIKLVQVREYGITEVHTDSSYGLTRREMSLNGPELDQIVAIAVDDRDWVYVLDAGYKKVAVFRPNGRIAKVILGGHGEGPGEFVTPLDVAVDQRRFVYVLDYHLQRIAIFDTAGVNVSTVGVPGGRALSMEVLSPNEIWLARTDNGRGGAAVLVIDSVGRVKTERIQQSDREHSFARHGDSGTMSRVAGQPALAVVPATWLQSDGRQTTRAGVDLLAGQDPYVADYRGHPMAMTPGGARGLLPLSRGRVAYLYYRRFGRDPSSRVENRLAILTAEGQLLADDALPFLDKFRNPASSMDGTRIYLGIHDPFPRVVEYKIVVAGDTLR